MVQNTFDMQVMLILYELIDMVLALMNFKVSKNVFNGAALSSAWNG